MQETKRQHYVPRTYLKHFGTITKEKITVGFIPKSNFSEAEYKETSVENICLEKNLYTLPGNSTQERMWVESLYNDVFEKHYDRVYEMLVDETKEQVTNEERELIISTIVSMYYRTSSWHNRINRMSDDMLASGYSLAKGNRKDSFTMNNVQISVKDKSLEEVQKHYRDKDKPMLILLQIQAIMKLIHQRSLTDSIMVDKINNEDDAFLTSDNPVIVKNQDNSHIVPIDSTNIFTLPIDSRHQVTIIRNDNPGWRHSIYRQTYMEDVAIFLRVVNNSSQVTNSEKFVIGKKSAFDLFFKDAEMWKNPDEKTRKLQHLLNKIGGQ